MTGSGALLAKYSAPVVDEACAARVEQSEMLFRARLRGLPNGQWRSRQYLDVQGETAIVRHRAPAGCIDFVISGKGARHPMSEGLADSGPAPVSFRSFESDTRHQGDRTWQ